MKCPYKAAKVIVMLVCSGKEIVKIWFIVKEKISLYAMLVE